MSRAGAVLFATLILASCRSDRVRVTMDATGTEATRTFASNALDNRDVERLREVYAAEPENDNDVGGRRFTGSFGNGLPSEIGNRNGLVAVRTRLGTTHFYYEAFAAGGTLWSDLERRMHAGELWVRIFGRWAARQIDDPSKREEWNAYVDHELVPLVDDAMLLWSAQLATVRFNRVSADVRAPSDASPMTDDERFAQRVGMPLLLLLAERGLLTAEEAHRTFLVSVDGNPARAERTWLVDTVLMPALLRQAQRFRPEAKQLDSAELVPMALSFWLYATTSPARNDLLLASPAISDEDKASLRAGKNVVTLPAPFGLDPLKAPKRTEMDLTITVASEPFSHNGEWNEETHEIRFRAAINEPRRRTTLFPPVYFAAWSEPDVAVQRALFGATILEGADLAAYALWREALPAATATRWDAALDELAKSGATNDLVAIERETRIERPLPAPLAEWLGEWLGAGSARHVG